MKKEVIKQAVDQYLPELVKIADEIYDLAEPGMEEVRSAGLLTDYLEKMGFQVEKGIAGLPTAFRAVYEQGQGGPSFGLLAEYDALKDIGHACGHHMQGPSVIGAALALRDTCKDQPYKIVIYGTPAEETIGGKIIMQEKGCFKDIDIALMMHAAPSTCVDLRCMALECFYVTFHGVESHAAMSPHKGKSAFDAALLSFQAIEFMREHVLEDSRMHYTILDAGGPSNIVPGRAKAEYTLRSYSTDYLENVIVPRFKDIIKGACLMTGTTCDLERSYPFKAKIPCVTLNDLIMENAHFFQAPRSQAQEKKQVPPILEMSCMKYQAAVSALPLYQKELQPIPKNIWKPEKTKKAHEALRSGSEILAGTCMDILEHPEFLQKMKEEFEERKRKEQMQMA